VSCGEVSALEVVSRVLQTVRSRDANINAYTDLTERRALEEAAAVDARRMRGEPMPALAGVPYAVKNLFDVEGLPTLAGGHRGRAGPVAASDATLVERAAQAGACLIGTLNMDAYAYGFTTENSFHGVTRNPHDPLRVAGGSSGGSGAAVGGRYVCVRARLRYQWLDPCAIVILRRVRAQAHYGGLSRGGSRPFVHNIDHVGPFARGARDLARIFDVLVGLDARDHACSRAAGPSVEAGVVRAAQEGLSGLRVARLNGYFDRWAGPDARTASRSVAMMFAAQEELDLPDVAAARSQPSSSRPASRVSFIAANCRRTMKTWSRSIVTACSAGSLLPATGMCKHNVSVSSFTGR